MAARRNRWELPNRVELEYRRALNRVNRQIITALGNCDDPARAVRLITQISQQPQALALYENAALNMVNNVYQHGYRQWRQAVANAPQGRALFAALQSELSGTVVGEKYYNLFWENVQLIKSVPADLAAELADLIVERTQQGKRSSEIMKEIQRRYPEASQGRIATIARTETSKAGTALTRARSEVLQLPWYVWRTSEDSRVRSSHHIMEGVLVRWSNPPSPEALAGLKAYGPYHAGDTFNCRCYAEPLVDVDFIRWPCKVYRHGRIESMTKAQFLEIAA